MQAYCNDLRGLIVAAYATGQCTIGQVASRFAVSISFVDKLLKRQHTSGSVAALPPAVGRYSAYKKLTASAFWPA